MQTPFLLKKDVLDIIKNGESSKVEFKEEKVHPESLAGEIVSFANFEGGYVFVGVDDNGNITGCQRKDIEVFVINICRQNIRPPITPIIEKMVLHDVDFESAKTLFLFFLKGFQFFIESPFFFSCIYW